MARQDARFFLVCSSPSARRQGESSSSAILVFKFPIKLRLHRPPRLFNLMKVLAQTNRHWGSSRTLLNRTKERCLQRDKVLVRFSPPHHPAEAFRLRLNLATDFLFLDLTGESLSFAQKLALLPVKAPQHQCNEQGNC
jgi:hypothetical protein